MINRNSTSANLKVLLKYLLSVMFREANYGCKPFDPCGDFVYILWFLVAPQII